MAIGATTLFRLVSARLTWLGQRQGLLAQNIANADTPDYAPRDLKEAAFARLVERHGARPPAGGAGGIGDAGTLDLARTDRAHQTRGGAPVARLALAGRARDASYEVSPDGNAVVLEEQMARMARTVLDHQLATGLYGKYVGMFRTALGGPPS